MEIFKVTTLEETQGRPTKEKHDGATTTDMQMDGLFSKKYAGCPKKVSDGWVERPKNNTSYKKISTNNFFLPLKVFPIDHD